MCIKVARFFLGQHTQTGKIYLPNNHKYTKWPYNIPNGHKIYQHLPLQDPQKWDFWFENIPSGNPDLKASVLFPVGL
jgi:hypothetical protein